MKLGSRPILSQKEQIVRCFLAPIVVRSANCARRLRFNGRELDLKGQEIASIFVAMAPRSSPGKSVRQSGARPPQPRAVGAQDLAKLKGLAGLSLRKLEALRARMKIRQFSKRSIVYQEGESDDAVYIVLSGIARLVCLNRKRERNLLEARSTGEVFEVLSLLQI